MEKNKPWPNPTPSVTSMTNAKEELVKTLERWKKEILAVDIYKDSVYGTRHRLPINYTQDQYKEFLDSLDFEYDDGYGTQKIYGRVWLTDGTWLERQDYDGSEWWELRERPEVPADLRGEGAP